MTGRMLRQDIDRRIDDVIAARIPRRARRTVVAVQDPEVAGRGGTATLLDGAGNESPGWRWFGVRPAVGDVVNAVIPPPGGTRYIDSIDSEQTFADLLTEDQLGGLVTKDALQEHVDSPLHLHKWTTPNTQTTDDNKWSRIAVGTIDARWGELNFDLKLHGAGSNSTTWVRGDVRGRVRQQALFGTDPAVALEVMHIADITASDIALVVTSNAGPTTVELHLRVTREYEYVMWVPILVDTFRGSWDWTGCEPFASALPSGTSTTATSI